MKHSFQARMLVAFGILSAAMPANAQAQAQESAGQARTATPGVEIVCMARPKGNVPQVRSEDRGRKFQIMAIAGSVANFEAKGFEVEDCNSSGFASRGQQIAFRNRMCSLASAGNEAVQNQLERALGEQPSVLCANAEMIVGHWRRETDKVDVEG